MNFRGLSPLPPYGSYEAALGAPIDSLPHTVFPHLNDTGAYIAPVRPDSRSSRFSPMPTRDHQQDVQEETATITIQVISFAATKQINVFLKNTFVFSSIIHNISFEDMREITMILSFVRQKLN